MPCIAFSNTGNIPDWPRFVDNRGERVLHGDVDTLLCAVSLVNISSIPRVVPFVQLSLFDGTDQLIRAYCCTSTADRIGVSGKYHWISFRLKSISLARRFKVDWASGALPTDMRPSPMRSNTRLRVSTVLLKETCPLPLMKTC